VMPPGVFIGNAKDLTLNIDTTTFKSPADYTNDSSDFCSAITINGASVAMTMLCASAANLALHLGGVNQAIGSAQVTATFPVVANYVYPVGTTFFTKNPIDLKQLATAATIGARDVDYKVTAFGFQLLKTFTWSASSFAATYTPDSSGFAMEGLQQSSTTVGLVFDGVNKFTGQPAVFVAPRLKLGLTDNFQLIGDGATEVKVKAECEPIIYGGTPKFFKLLGFK
jgi:hypothetical protein